MHRPGLVALSALALASALLCAPRATAGDETYVVAAGCPPRQDFDRKLRERLGETQPGSYTTEVRVEEGNSDYSGTVRVTTRNTLRVRTLSAASCSELVDALALSAALSIEDVEREAGQTPPAKEPQTSPDPKPKPIKREPLRFGAGLSLPYRSTVGPDGALGVGALLTLEAPGEGFAPSMLLHGFRHSATARGSAGSADLTTWGAAVDACPLRFGTHLSLVPCLSFEIASLSAEARGVSFPKDSSRVTLAVGAGARGRFVVTPRFALSAELFLLIPLGRHSFSFDTGERVFETPSAGARAALAAVFFIL